jgi:conjugal transfer/type IV secretion protein DotA/TraY
MIPFIFAILMAMWVFGSLTAYYVPMIPYILFTLGSIAWLIAVIEAMVAAPLLALGILHPEGQHDIFGHASAGIMLLASVFLRPALMIIGFWASYIMIGIAISLLNGGFFYMAISVTGTSMPIWGAITFTGIYILFVLIVVNRGFSLIYVIPDRIFRWIGGPQEDTGVAQDLQQLKGGYEQQAQKMGQSAGGAMKAQRELASQRPRGGGEDKPTDTQVGGSGKES